MELIIPFCIWFALLNRARGSRLFDRVSSTVIGRMISMGLMAVSAAALYYPASSNQFSVVMVFGWTYATLMLWCSPAWDRYWSAAIGNDPHHSRLWGLATMTLRQLLVLPCLVGLAILIGKPHAAFWAIGSVLLGLPYYVSGYYSKRVNVIRNAELSAGAIIGAMIFTIITG